MHDLDRYLIPTELVPQVQAVFLAALLEIGIDIGEPDGWKDGQPWWWGLSDVSTYQASTVARLSVGIEPLPDYETFIAYQRYAQWSRS